jgi:hypothetical protein
LLHSDIISNMKQEIFEDRIRHHLRTKPFHPFVVELIDGKRIVVEQPSLAMGGGAATIVTDDALIEFACENVRDIRLAPVESLS